jgi:hypothetical protein
MFDPEEYLLETGALTFDTSDASTYMLLCYAGPRLITSQVDKAKQLATLSDSDNGPFKLSWDPSNLKLICISAQQEFDTPLIFQTPLILRTKNGFQ